MNNEPAFPCWEPYEEFDDHRGEYKTKYRTAGGMSLRDYFAAKAMQSLIVSLDPDSRESLQTFMDINARAAYGYADAMLKARA